MTTPFQDFQQWMSILSANWPSLAAGTDPNGILGYWSGTNPPTAKVPSTNADPLLLVIIPQLIDFADVAEFGWNLPMTNVQRKAFNENCATFIQNIITQMTAGLYTPLKAFADGLPSS